MNELVFDILVILILILFNGFFTGSEIAIISLRRVELDEFIKKGDLRGRLLNKLKSKPDRFFATVQIGVTLLSTLASVYGGARLMRHIEPYLKDLNIGFFNMHEEQIALLLLVLTISYLSLVFGELIPKSIALRYSSAFSSFVSYPLYFFSLLFSGFTFFLTSSSNIILKLFHKNSTSFSKARLHEEEIRHILREGVQVGTIEDSEQEFISNILEINDTSAREVMTPRVNLTALSINAPLKEIENTVCHGNYSRIPVFRESLDKIEGVLYMKDYMGMRMRSSQMGVEKLLRPVYHVPESMKIDKILREMQRRQIHMAVVVDEYGGTAGVLTMEDILEEIVGDIRDIAEAPEEQPIIALPTGKYLLTGACPISEFNEYFPKHLLPESDGYASIAGFVIEETGRFPEVGEKIIYKEIEFELLRRMRQKLVQFRLQILETEADKESDNENDEKTKNGAETEKEIVNASD